MSKYSFRPNMCAKIIKGSTFVIIKLSYTKQTNQLWIVNMSYLLQPVCPSPHSRVTQQSYQHINISSTCHIILYFILFVDVPLNLISKMFFLSFASLSIILNKSDLSRMPLFYLSFHFLFFFFFLSSGCTYYSYFSSSTEYITFVLILQQDLGTDTANQKNTVVFHILCRDEVKC